MTDSLTVGKRDTIVTSRLPNMLYVLITTNTATLKEIRDDYSIEEVLDLYELCLVNIYNRSQNLHKEGM